MLLEQSRALQSMIGVTLIARLYCHGLFRLCGLMILYASLGQMIGIKERK